MESRKTALEVLNALDRGDKTLDALLNEMENKKFPFKKDRALLNAVVFGVLRMQKRLDWIIAHFSNIPLDNIDPAVKNILRMGLFQIVHLDRIPASAAVNTSVELAKLHAAPWTVKFVNALLRNAATRYETVPFPDREKDLCKRVSVEKSFPEPLIQRWLERFGEKETEALCDAVNTIAPITARVNIGRTNWEKLLKSLQNETDGVKRTSISPDGVVFTGPRKPIAEMTAFRLGWFQPQDEAAQLVTHLLAPAPGDLVLDACAGLGGKTGHIAQLMENRGKIVAMDVDRAKLKRLSRDMDRQVVTIVTTFVQDLDSPLKAKLPPRFDRVLLDAPCSGLGTLRRNPDARWKIDLDKLPEFAGRQKRFLDRLAPAIKRGGVLVYAVCSLEPEETFDVAAYFLGKHPEFEAVKPPESLVEKDPTIFTKEGYFMSFPHRHDMDGFFAARFVRKK